MLNNKSGMLRILALVLCVLMLVPFAACNKDEGSSAEDIQAAIDAAMKAQEEAQASKDAEAAAQAAAQASSLAASQAAVQASLEAAAAEAAKAAEEAAAKAAAAEAAAKAEASKAAASAEAAAKAEASKAAASASKAAEEAKKAAEAAAASASKAAEEASKLASSISQSIADAATATTESTTTASTTAPIAKEDTTATYLKYAELKHKYTTTKADLYVAEAYAELVLLFDKAGVELTNAMTVEAAESIYATLETDVLGIENVEMAAAKVQAMIAALGDIETDVFTTQAEKIADAEDALEALYMSYADYFDTVFADEYEDEIDDDEFDRAAAEKKATKLGVNIADLDKATAKKTVLVDYIKTSFQKKVVALYDTTEGEFDEDGDDLYKTGTAHVEANRNTVWTAVENAYYYYLVLSKVNGGDLADAEIPVDWDYLYNPENGKAYKYSEKAVEHPWNTYGVTVNYANTDKVYDKDAVIATFTAEDFIEVYATPYLNAALRETQNTAITKLSAQLETTAAQLYTNIDTALGTGFGATYKETGKEDQFFGYFVSIGDADILEDIFDEFEETMETETFVDDYKGSATLDDAKAAIWKAYIEAYLNAANELIELSKTTAIEAYAEYYELRVEKLEADYEEKETETAIATLAAKKADEAAKQEAFIANVNAAPTFTMADLDDAALREDYNFGWDSEYDEIALYAADYIANFNVKVSDEADALTYGELLMDYINDLVVDSIKDNFATSVSDTQAGVLGDYVTALVADLEVLRERLNPANEDLENDLYWIDKGSAITYMAETGKENGYRKDDKNEYYFTNTDKYLKLVAGIDDAIADLEAVTVDIYTDKEVEIKTANPSSGDGDYGSKNKNKTVYWANEVAKSVYYNDANDDKQSTLETAIHNALKSAKSNSATISNALYWTLVKTDDTVAVTYTYTATEQALEAASLIFDAAYKTVMDTLSASNKAVSDYKGYITSGDYKDEDEKTPYKGKFTAIKDSVATNATLQAEVVAYASVFQGYMDTYSDDKYDFADRNIADVFKQDNTIKTNGKHITTPDLETLASDKNDTAGQANQYLKGEATSLKDRFKNLVKNELEAYLHAFEDTFYSNNTYTESNVISLWQYKTATIKTLNALRDDFKNTYDFTYVPHETLPNQYVQSWFQVDDDEKDDNPADYAWAFEYDTDRVNNYSESSAKGKTYEEKVDALFDSMISSINAVTLEDAGAINSAVLTYQKSGKATALPILAKFDGNDYKVNGKVCLFELDYAKSRVDAYAINTLGIDLANEALDDCSITEYDSTYTVDQAYAEYKYDSQIYKNWNSIINDKWN